LSVSAGGGGDVDEVVVDSIAFPSPSARGGIRSPKPFSLSLGRSEAVTVFSGSEVVSIQSAGQSYWVRKALRLAIGHGMRVLQERRSERKRRQSVNALDKETGNAATSPKIELRDAHLDPSYMSYGGIGSKSCCVIKRL
jgi:hypothetical protein